MRRMLPARRLSRPVIIACRSLSSGDIPSVKVFDRAAKQRQRDRAVAADPSGEYDYLREHIASVLVDRIEVTEQGCRAAPIDYIMCSLIVVPSHSTVFLVVSLGFMRCS